MAVKLRLSRVGTKNNPIYRLVATDSRNKRDGKSLEILGTYHGVSGKVDHLHEDRVAYWISQGAQQTDSFKKIHRQYKQTRAEQSPTEQSRATQPTTTSTAA